MRRAEPNVHSERALTLALVLMAVGYVPGAFAAPARFTAPVVAPARSAFATTRGTRSVEARTTPVRGERRVDPTTPHVDATIASTAPWTALASRSCVAVALNAAPRRTPVLATASRGPPILA